jgi:hypothetical protein
MNSVRVGKRERANGLFGQCIQFPLGEGHSGGVVTIPGVQADRHGHELRYSDQADHQHKHGDQELDKGEAGLFHGIFSNLVWHIISLFAS